MINNRSFRVRKPVGKGIRRSHAVQKSVFHYYFRDKGGMRNDSLSVGHLPNMDMSRVVINQ